MRKISLLLVLAAALGACKKDNETAPGKTDLLAAKSWRIVSQSSTYSSSSINNGTAITSNKYAAKSTCERDNFFKFSSTGTLILDEGESKCDSSDPQKQHGSWSFNSDQTKLTLNDPSQAIPMGTFDVVSLSATKLELRYSYSYSSGGISATQTEDITLAAF
ncbi:MAG TPA: hypothetical protein VFO93_14710 [Hymenobacter sp.]|uniref:hypothetical protein n=1 Tax=Hymenobacter sp. TaxID=1898978 RepID=UPI002D7EDC92|nr:hypothetical protein [Hymenobacter sp.]HET9504792.1 hypothetical protein [Hymenobacter sp.]